MHTVRFIVILFLLPITAWSQYDLKIKIEVADSVIVKSLQFGVRRFRQKDSLLLDQHNDTKKVILNQYVTGAEYYFVILNNIRKDFYFEPGHISIAIEDAKLEKISIKKSLAHFEYENYLKGIRANINFTKVRNVMAAKSDYVNSSRKLDSTRIKKYDSDIDSLGEVSREAGQKYLIKWFELHPNSWINTKVLFDNINQQPDSLIIDLFEKLPIEQKKNSWSDGLKYWITNLCIGSKISFNELLNIKSNINLPKIDHANFVLVDFWASWCIPCRREFPKLKTIYTAFKSTGFEIIGISLDKNKEEWLKAIQEDKLLWNQFTSGANQNLYERYYIASLPCNFLIDGNGKILAKNIDLEHLESFLNQNAESKK